MAAQPEYIIEMLGITKRFPGIVANDNITLQLRKGEIHALLGENGAGKSTLMSVLFGMYQPEEGIIKKNGEVVKINDPNDATRLGIGMVLSLIHILPCSACHLGSNFSSFLSMNAVIGFFIVFSPFLRR